MNGAFRVLSRLALFVGVCAGCVAPKHVEVVRTSSDLAALDGERVEVVGKYMVYDMGRFRITTASGNGSPVTSNQVVYVELSDETAIRIGARPAEERVTMHGRSVIARGRFLSRPEAVDDEVAHMTPAPLLVEVESIEPRDR